MWSEKSDREIKAEVQSIVRTSQDDDEIRRRIRDELGCPYGAAIASCVPTDNTGREARAIVRALGGLIRKDGAMVMLMMHGPRGNTISV